MEKEFAPCKEAFIVRMFWLAWPVVLVVVMDQKEMLIKPHYLIDAVLAVGVAYGLIFSIWLHGKLIKFQKACLAITDFFGQEKLYAWKLIKEARVETQKRLLFPSRQLFVFYYGDSLDDMQRIEYWLSELSAEDRERALVKLVMAFPGLRDYSY